MTGRRTKVGSGVCGWTHDPDNLLYYLKTADAIIGLTADDNDTPLVALVDFADQLIKTLGTIRPRARLVYVAAGLRLVVDQSAGAGRGFGWPAESGPTPRPVDAWPGRSGAGRCCACTFLTVWDFPDGQHSD